MNRRRFLKSGGRFSMGMLASPWVAPLLSGCATVDNVFNIDKSQFDDEVIIVGGGSAGLMAALTCKKRKIPYRIFEASQRLGGRARSASYATGKSDEVLELDLGVDTVDERHRRVFELCRELNLELVEKSVSSRWDNALLWEGDKFIPIQKSRSELESIFGVMAEAQIRTLGDRKPEDWENARFTDDAVIKLDQISLEAFLLQNKIRLTSTTEHFLSAWCFANWGRSSETVSALAAMLYLDPENRGPAQYRLRGGFGGLTQTMFGRSSGVIPEHLVQTNHALTDVEEEDGRFTCTFTYRTSEGGPGEFFGIPRTKIIHCRRLVIALPLSQIAEVQWRGDLRSQMAAWTSGHHGALSPQAKSFHALNGNPQNRIAKDKWAVGQKQIFRIEINEEENLAAITSASKAFSPEGKGFPSSLAYQGTPVSFVDWNYNKWIKGARWNQALGAITNYQNWKLNFKSQGQIAFAGEYDSTTYPGTLEAALTSAEKAVAAVLKENS